MRSLSARLDLCSINTATLGHNEPIERVIDEVAQFGFGGICLWRRDLEGRSVERIARQIRDAGLSVSGYCRSTYMPALSVEAFEANIADNARAIDQAAALNAACFVIVVGSLPSGSRDLPAARGQVADGTACLLGHARKAGVRLALEPLHPMYTGDRSCLNRLMQALDLADAIEPSQDQNPFLGVAIDLYHVWWDPMIQPSLARAGAARRIFAFHVVTGSYPLVTFSWTVE